MNSILNNIQIAWPEIILLVTACLALLAELFLRKYIRCITFAIACLGLIAATVMAAVQVGEFKTVILNGLYVGDDVGNLMKVFIYITTALSFIYSYQYLEERNMLSGDYYILGLFSTLGMSILVSAHSMISLYLGLELFSLPVYAMVAMRKSDNNASEAAMKYFVMGAIASGMLLYGFSLIYGATGKMEFGEIASAISSSWAQNGMLLSFSLVFIVTSIAFKMATVPFHMWAPDVYQGAPTSVTLFISAGPKIAALAMAFRLLTLALPDMILEWQQLLMIISVLSVILGNVIAIVQSNLKRLFAYSAIAHLGYTMFGVLAGTPEGYGSALYYILVYSLMATGAFGLLVLMSRQGLEIENVEDLNGLNSKSPWLAFLMMIVMFSMAGVPPTVGFITKFLVLKSLFDSNMVVVGVIGLVFAVIGSYYYLRIVKTMYFDSSQEKTPVTMPLASGVVYSINCLALLYWGIFPAVLINACLNAFR